MRARSAVPGSEPDRPGVLASSLLVGLAAALLLAAGCLGPPVGRASAPGPPRPSTSASGPSWCPSQGEPCVESAHSPPPPGRGPDPERDEEVDGEARRRLVERAVEILDLVAAGALDDARAGIEDLAIDLPLDEPARVVRDLLLRRLERGGAPVSAAPAALPAAPPAAASAGSGPVAAPPADARVPVASGIEAETLRRLEEARARDPGDEKASKALADLLKKIGLEHYSRGDSARAVASWQKAIEVLPGDPETLRFLERATTVNRKL